VFPLGKHDQRSSVSSSMMNVAPKAQYGKHVSQPGLLKPYFYIGLICDDMSCGKY